MTEASFGFTSMTFDKSFRVSVHLLSQMYFTSGGIRSRLIWIQSNILFKVIQCITIERVVIWMVSCRWMWSNVYHSGDHHVRGPESTNSRMFVHSVRRLTKSRSLEFLNSSSVEPFHFKGSRLQHLSLIIHTKTKTKL